jgi:hypothetical protein
MSLVADSYFPPPQGWEAFEGMVFDFFTARLVNPNLKRYGRQGQAQYGVDIAGAQNGGFLGIQSKNHPGGKITTKEIDAEIAKAEGFQPTIHQYILATSALRDAKITQYIFEVSSERTRHGKFSVDIYFWEDICHELVRNPGLLAIHFPELQTAPSAKADEEKATELKKRQALANRLLPIVARVQTGWDETLQSDANDYFFEHDIEHCFRNMLKLEDILKHALATPLVLHNDIMTERFRGLLVRCRELMVTEFENSPLSAWTQYRSEGAVLIGDVRRALLDFIKEEEANDRQATDNYFASMRYTGVCAEIHGPDDW